MHALLAATASIVWAFDKASDLDICFQTSEAVKGVNLSLTRTNGTCPLDLGSVYAVIILWIVEKIFQCPPWDMLQQEKGYPNQADIHRDALRRMVSLRGGLPALEHDRNLFSFVSW